MRTSFIFLPMMFLSANAHSESIEQGLKNQHLTVRIYGMGGHTGDVLRVRLKNNLSKSVSYTIEAGRRLNSENDGEQDMLVTKTASFALLPKEIKAFDVFAMCCQAHNASPDSGSSFLIGNMADSSLVLLARYIDQNKWYKNSTAQNAVWVVSDGNDMSSIGGNDPVSRQLQKFVSKLTGKEIPKYRTEYVQSNNGTAFYSHPAKISGTFEYETFTNGLVTFGVYDAEGHAVEMFFTDVPRDKGYYVFNYEFRTSHLPKGDYYARLRLDGQIKKEQKFSF